MFDFAADQFRGFFISTGSIVENLVIEHNFGLTKLSSISRIYYSMDLNSTAFTNEFHESMPDILNWISSLKY